MGDSLITICQFQGRLEKNLPYGNKLGRHIRELLKQLESYSIYHIRRNINGKVDHMANQGVGLIPGTLEINGNITTNTTPP